MSRVQLSIEEHNARHLSTENDIHQLLGLQWLLPNEYDSSSVSKASHPCDSLYLIDPQNSGIEKDEFAMYLKTPGISKGMTIDDSSFLAGIDRILTSLEQSAQQDTPIPLKSNRIFLSQSVGVTMPEKVINSSDQIEIVHELELDYKPRYKSDYFAQNGGVRRPRYVADRTGNHCVTLKIPAGIRGRIRVDWLTLATATGHRYSMPYRFQENNESAATPDCNPMYVKITNQDSLGTMKLYLVLIKSKQDELKTHQPLRPFHPVQDCFGISDKSDVKPMATLMPKQLIQQYQLDKSQLAFTFCASGADGESCIPEWDTTVYSTVLTEIQTDSSKKRKVTCPTCSHNFEIKLDDVDDIAHEKVMKKRKKC